MQESKQVGKKVTRNFMSRNVTQFRHLISNCYITENDLNWVINLRDNHLNNIQKKSEAPPEVFFKQTKSSQFKIRKKDQKTINIKPNQYDHLFLKGEDHVNQTQNQLNFYSSLRKDSSIKTPSRIQSQKQFVSLPFRDRRSTVKFIKKECIKKVKNITEDDLQSGLDGAHRQAQYTEKIVKVKNYACLSAFTKVRGRKQVSLPSLAWQMGLRNYR